LAITVALAAICLGAEQTAAQLFREAEKADKAGQTVRAYLLYVQAAAKDPNNMAYWSRAQALRPIAEMAQPGIRPPAAPETSEGKPKASEIDPEVVGNISDLDIVDAKRHPLPPRELKAAPGLQDFDLKGDSKTLFEKVADAFKLLPVFDSAYQPIQNIHFVVQGVDYKTALRLLQDATNSFVVPVADRLILVASDSTQKRTELESTAAAVIPVPEPVTVQEVQEIATAVRGTLEIQRLVVDTARRMVLIRDRVWKVRAAEVLLHDLMRAKPQVAIDIDFVAIDQSKSSTWGIDLPTQFPIVSLGNFAFGRTPNLISAIPAGFVNFLTFGAGSSFMGIGLTNATLFAQASRGTATTLLQSEVVSSDGQPVSFHVGQKYPIVTGLYSGATSAAGSTGFGIPPPQFNFEDLGLVLKITPHVHGMDEMTLEVNAEYKLLGASAIDGIPIVSSRKFESKLRLVNGEWAVLAGLVDEEDVKAITGIPGLMAIPLLRKNTRSQSHSETMILLKPHLLNLPPTEATTVIDWIGTETRPRSL
jgi:type II secretory pathway component HofQ